MREPLPLLDGVIKETLRLQASMPSGVQLVTPTQGLKVGERVIPGNVICRIPNWIMWRDPRFFVDPEKFIPERWTTKSHIVLNDSIFWPFGNGKYHCVGSQLAWMQLRAVLASIVTKFKFTYGDTNPITHRQVCVTSVSSLFTRALMLITQWETSGKDFFLMTYGPLWLKFEARNHN